MSDRVRSEFKSYVPIIDQDGGNLEAVCTGLAALGIDIWEMYLPKDRVAEVRSLPGSDLNRTDSKACICPLSLEIFTDGTGVYRYMTPTNGASRYICSCIGMMTEVVPGMDDVRAYAMMLIGSKGMSTANAVHPNMESKVVDDVVDTVITAMDESKIKFVGAFMPSKEELH